MHSLAPLTKIDGGVALYWANLFLNASRMISDSELPVFSTSFLSAREHLGLGLRMQHTRSSHDSVLYRLGLQGWWDHIFAFGGLLQTIPVRTSKLGGVLRFPDSRKSDGATAVTGQVHNKWELLS